MLSKLTQSLSRKKIREGSSSEESYASAGIASSGTTASSPPGHYRQRRTRASSSDNDPIINDLINEDFRAGGPELAAMPCASKPLHQTHPAYEMWETSEAFRDTIRRTLSQHGIDVRSIGIEGRISTNPYLRFGVLPTLVISARKQDPSDPSWISACQKLRLYFINRKLPSLNVEILDPRASIQNVVDIVPKKDPIYPLWEKKILPMIRQNIGLGGWIALECFRWGPDSDDRSKNPTTVVLTVNYDTYRDWRPVREAIVDILQHFRLHHVAVAILRGHIWKGRSPESAVLPNNAWETHVQCGLSMGPAGSDFSTSTFGAVLELQFIDAGPWVPLGLTCFHSVMVRDEPTSEAEALYHKYSKLHGLKPDENFDAPVYLRMDQPSLGDHMHRMNLLNASIKDVDENQEIIQYRQDIKDGKFIIPSDERRYESMIAFQREDIKRRDRAQEFFASGEAFLGYVFAASGYRISPGPDPGQLDWALILMRGERYAKNKILPVGIHDGVIKFRGDPIREPSTKEIQNGDPVFKLGRTTNATEGMFSGLKSLVLETGKGDSGETVVKETLEHWIAAYDNADSRFSKPGDSGAVVLDKNGRFVGLLFGGGVEKNITYFTPWKRLFDDIKHITGALKVRPY